MGLRAVGFIGLGTMGLPMTRHLIEKGYDVHVKSRSRGPVEKALAWGAKEAGSPLEMAQTVDVLMMCLPLPETVEDVVFGEQGIVHGAREGLIVADHSTVSPALNKKVAESLAEKGAGFLDAPISGGPMGAEAGTLTVMVGGEKDHFTRAKPVFDAFGKNVVHVGDVGSGSAVKLVNQLLVGVHTAALSEAFVLAVKAGLDPQLVTDVIRNSTGHSYMIDRTIDLIQDRDFAQRFSIDLLLKDMKLASQWAGELNSPLDLGRLAEEMVHNAQRAGYGREDVAAVIRPVEEKAGVKVQRQAP